MREIVYDFEEFKRKVDATKSIHHRGVRKQVDRHGVFFKLMFEICGVNKKTGTVLIFENPKITTIASLSSQKRLYDTFVQQYAEPLGSTEGALEP
jgi:hypothetical protein